MSRWAEYHLSVVTSDLATSCWAEVNESAILQSDYTMYLADHQCFYPNRLLGMSWNEQRNYAQGAQRMG